MNRAIKAEIQRVMSAKTFWISLALFVSIYLLSSIEDLTEIIKNGAEFAYHSQFYLQKIQSQEIRLTLPFLCVLPSATLFLDDVNSGYIKFYVSRIGKQNYIKGKLAACFLSGGCILLLGGIFSWGGTVLLITPVEKILAPNVMRPYYLYDLLQSFFLLFLNGALWALCGMVLSALTESKHMAYASSFVVCFLLVILHERYFRNIFSIYPYEWLVPTGPPIEFVPVVILLGLIEIALCKIFMEYAEERIENV